MSRSGWRKQFLRAEQGDRTRRLPNPLAFGFIVPLFVEVTHIGTGTVDFTETGAEARRVR